MGAVVNRAELAESAGKQEAFPARRRWPRLTARNALAATGGAIIALVVVAAVAAPVLAPHDPISQNLAMALKPPFWAATGDLSYPLGTDHYGRDVFSRLVFGARVSLFVAVSAALIGASIGVSLGLIAGYFGGWIDTLVMRLVDLNLAFPLVLLALAIVAILGPNLRNLILVMSITAWMIYARVVRGITRSMRAEEFVQSARASGASDARIVLRHLLPNMLAPVVVIWTFEVARIILLESALSFLGLGVPPPTPTWGRMLAEGRDYLTVAGWTSVFPGLAIMITVLGINFLGDGARDLLDPRLRKAV
jgi:peptide/nickel transport system permease protein